MAASEAFYEPVDATHYLPTEATMSPWDARLQHGGPPSALAVHALLRAHPRPEMRVTQVVVHFLGPIPREQMEVQVEIERPGRRIELSRISMFARERKVVVASVWRSAARNDVPTPQSVLARRRAARLAPLPAPQAQETFEGLSGWGYGEAIEWRFTRGGFRTLGPAGVWTRLRIPLVRATRTSGVERVATVADSANGLSREFELREFLFVPTSIVLTLEREPEGEWMYFGASTDVGAEGLGFTSCTLGDASGVLGIASQPLLFEPQRTAASQGSATPEA